MAIANGTCISFCNQPNAHYLATSRESRRYVVAFRRFAGTAGIIWLRRESRAHFGLPWVRPWDYRGVTRMERGFNACQTHSSIYPSIFNRFPVIQPGISKVIAILAHFCTFWPPLGTPWDNRGKCYMDRMRFRCLSNASRLYPSIFNRFPVIQHVSLKVRHFITYFAHFGLPWVGLRPWDNRGKFTWIERGFNAGQTHRSMFPSIFNRFPVIQNP